MQNYKLFRALALTSMVTFGARTFAKEPRAFEKARLTLTDSDLRRIENESGVAARGGTVRIVDCHGAYGFATIQSAIDASNDGDVVVVLPNDCNVEERWFEHISFLGKSIQLQSVNPNDMAIVEQTVLDGGDGGNTIQFPTANSSQGVAHINGITIVGGSRGVNVTNATIVISRCTIRSTLNNAIYTVSSDAFDFSLELSNCSILQNKGVEIVRAQNVALIVERCLLADNSGRRVLSTSNGVLSVGETDFIHNGTDGYMWETCAFFDPIRARIEHCRFIQNAGSIVGAVYVEFHSSPDNEFRMAHCEFAGNRATGTSESGGVKNAVDPIRIEGCTFMGNVGHRTGAIMSHSPGITVTNSILRENRATSNASENSQIWNLIQSPTYNNIQGVSQSSGNGNVDTDPLFVDPGHWDDNGTPGDGTDDVFIPGDYHLRPGSPCIDAGDPAFTPSEGETDLDGNPRRLGCRIDIGAYEAPRGAPGSGDFDGNAAVDLEDIVYFVDSLLQAGGGACLGDINGDGVSNGADVQLFIDLII